MKGLTVTLIASLAVNTAPALAREKCAPASDRLAEIVGVQTKLFAALEGEDLKAWQQLTAPDFVAFESGQRYSRTDMFAAIRSAHAAGKHFQWRVADARIEADCTVATLTYVNRGLITDGASQSPVSWLETATFRYVAGLWRVMFVESMRENVEPMREKAADDQSAPHT